MAKLGKAPETGLRDVVLDVREDLRAGREPFSKIMAAVRKVGPGGTLTLYATFKPVPLIAILRRQGFTAEAEKIEGGDWRVVFRRGGTAPGGEESQDAHGEEESQDAPGARDAQDAAAGAPGDAGASAASGAGGGELDVIELDNRGLEPPEPMVRTLEAINELKAGGRIVGYYDRRPMFLLPKLEQMGFVYEIENLDGGGVKVVISRES